VLIPFSYSITQGIIWGFLSWSLLKVVSNRAREVPLALWIIDVLALVALALE
jgi:AGZA family xanthine/uracil permease-like MFS transporter